MSGKRPNKKGKPSVPVPGAVKAIYAVMIVLVLAICGLVFWYTFSQTNKEENSSGNGSSYALINPTASNNSNNSANSDNSDDLSSAESSYDAELSEPSDTSDSGISASGSDPETSDSSNSSENSGSGRPPQVDLPRDYSEEFFANDLFIGDSIFTGLDGYFYLPSENVAAQIGYTPYKAMNNAFDRNYSGSAADYAKERQPKRIFIMLGTNALSAGASAIAESYSNLVKQLQADCPDSEICVISITPVNEAKAVANGYDLKNTDINIVNDQLKLMCNLLGVEYYDFNSLVKDDSGNFRDDLSEKDGLHFKGITYPILLSGLQTFMS